MSCKIKKKKTKKTFPEHFLKKVELSGSRTEPFNCRPTFGLQKKMIIFFVTDLPIIRGRTKLHSVQTVGGPVTVHVGSVQTGRGREPRLLTVLLLLLLLKMTVRTLLLSR